MKLLKTCAKCGQEKPLSDFNKNKKAKDGYSIYCKKCHNVYYYRNKDKMKSIVKDAPKIEDSIAKECKEYSLNNIPSRLLISELRIRGYRGELELVTIQKVVI